MRSNRQAWSERRISRRRALGTISGAALAMASVACTASSATAHPAPARQRTKGYPNASILDAVSKVEAVDKSTVKITLNASSADFPLSIAAPQSLIVAREAVDLHGDLKDGPLIGTGAFIVDKTDPTGTSILRRNPDYFLPGLPYVDTYEYTVIQDSA